MGTHKHYLGHLENVLICGVPCSIYGTGDHIVCMRLSDGAAMSLKQSELELLSRMSTAKTLGEWLETLCRQDVDQRLKHGKYSMLARLVRWASSVAEDTASKSQVKICEAMYGKYLPDIQTLLANELLVPVEKSLQELMSARKVAVDNCRISTLCIPTCGRSEYLSRCVSSFSDSLRAHGRNDAKILIVDDSPDEASEARSLELVTSLQASAGPPIEFVGYKERRNLITALLGKDAAQPEVIQFALNTERLLSTEGSARNTIMLLTVGECILQADDDTVCAYVSGVQAKSVVISGAPDPYQTYFYSDRESNLRNFPTTSGIDPFSVHESVLGKSLSDIVQCSEAIKWDKMNPNVFLGNYAACGRIDITTTGASGDPGMSSCCPFLFEAPTDTLRRIYLDRESYQVATNVRQVLRIVPELTICRGSVFQAMSFGIDNTKLQPPFFPVGRGLDDAFSLLYFHSSAGALIGHVPFAITHLSDSYRRYEGWPSSEYLSTTWCTPHVPLTYFVKLCVADTQSHIGATTASSLKSIGEQMIAIGSISRGSFRSYIRDKHVSKVFQIIAQCEESLNRDGFECAERTRDIVTLMNGFRKSVIESKTITPGDFPRTIGVDDALDKVQSYILMYGQLMVHWECIVAAAREIRISAPIGNVTASSMYAAHVV